MKENGYSCAATISLISPEIVAEIERDTGNDLRDVINSLNCCNADTYKKQTSFKFLPGHNRFILNMPAEIKKMKSQMKTRKHTPNIRARNKQKNLQSNDLLTETDAESNSVVAVESFDNVHGHNIILEENESSTSNHDSIVKMLELELINKLKQRCKSEGGDWGKSLTVNSISEMEINIDSHGDVIGGKCRLVCPICATKYLCKYERFWQTSNLLKHFKSHENGGPSNLNSENRHEGSKTVPMTSNLADYSDNTSDDDLQQNIQQQIDSLYNLNETSKIQANKIVNQVTRNVIGVKKTQR